MPMFPWSRYRYCNQLENENGVLFIDEREPFRYREEGDNRFYRAKEGDTWWGLAHVFFDGVQRACGLWWLLCEYQPTPVLDPTLGIEPNTLIVIPSTRVLRTQVFTNEQRRYH